VIDLPEPLTPADCDLRDFPFMPLDIVRLFNSEFHARSNDAEFRAGFTLWCKSFHQVPAGSIPDDDVSLARLAELGRDVKGWKKLREGALYGWLKCNDQRWYHPVVSEKAIEAWNGKKAQRSRTSKARLQALLSRLSQAKDSLDAASIEDSIQTLLSTLSQTLSQNEFEALTESVNTATTEAKRKRKGEGQREGKGKVINTDAEASGAEAPSESGEMTKDELWASGKSLLAQSGMPDKQCGTFVGGLVKQYGPDAVMDAVRRAVLERPADPAAFLKATCQHISGERRPGAAKQSRHNGFDSIDYREGVNDDGSF
jgi:hypothetical protein